MRGENKTKRAVRGERSYCSKIAILAASSMLSMPSLAATENDDGNARQLKKVIVSATRMEADIDDVARSIAVVEKDEIETIQAKSAAEILRYQPNVTIAGGPRSGQQSINIRGLSDEKVLQVVDGVRQGFDSGHRPGYFLDPELLKSIEVVKGPVSSLWGSGAIGGVVSQQTIDAADLLKPNQNFGGFIKTGHNNNNDQSTTSSALAGRTDNIDWLFSGYYRDSNDSKLGNGDDLGSSATRDYGLLAKAEWQIDDAQSVGFNYRTAEVNGAVPNNGAASVGTSNFVIDRKQETSTLALEYGLNTDSPLINSRAKVYWNTIDMGESRVSDGRSDDTELEVFGVQLTNKSDFDGVTLLYGFDGYREEFNALRSGANRPLPPKAETDVWGVFAQANIDLNDAWRVEIAGRYDDFFSESKNLNIERSEDEFSPSAALVWQTTDWLELALRHDRAFRAPGSEELYTTGTHFCIGPPFGCNTFVSNPNLKPESAANTELLAKMRFSNVFANDELRINASVFKNKVDDFIEQVVTNPSFTPPATFSAGTSTWKNVDKAELKGFEVAADYQLDKLRLKLAYGQVRGEDDETGRDLSNIPTDTLTADLSYAFLNEQLTAGVRVTDAASQNNKPTTDDNDYEGYTVGDIYATWQPESMDSLKVGLTVNNISDKHYRRAFEQLFETGREAIISVRYEF
ncbi:MAG: TonB-dependent hemoglobin/transferrin/lactoferrin family receptor [Pseudomonadales bacterium]